MSVYLGGNEKTCRYRRCKNDPNDINGNVLKFLLNDIKLPDDKTIIDSYIIIQLLNNNIIKNKSELSHNILRKMKQIIFRHNANIYINEIQKYKIGEKKTSNRKFYCMVGKFTKTYIR